MSSRHSLLSKPIEALIRVISSVGPAWKRPPQVGCAGGFSPMAWRDMAMRAGQTARLARALQLPVRCRLPFRDLPEGAAPRRVRFRTSAVRRWTPSGLIYVMSGGPSRNRTGVQGFAVLCVTTPPSGRGLGPFQELPAPVKGEVSAPPLREMAGSSTNGGWRHRMRPVRPDLPAAASASSPEADLIPRCITGI